MAENNNNNNNNNNKNPPEELMDVFLTPSVPRNTSCIIGPNVAANNFEIKPALLSVVHQNQFAGGDEEDPHIHLDKFLLICDTVKMNGVADDAIRLRLFQFSLKDQALKWLHQQPTGSIASWDDLAAKFLANFFPITKYNQLVNEISNFTQQEGESLCAAWRRFKDLQRRCPQYEVQPGPKVRIFFNGITPASRMVINAAARGSLRQKTPTQALELFESMASLENESVPTQPKKGIYQLESNDAMLAAQKAMSQQLTSLTSMYEKFQASAFQTQPTPLVCDFCGGEHENTNCGALGGNEATLVNGIWNDQRNSGNFQKNQSSPYGNTYNPR
ncbi:uncharacterized protein LOC133298459 [Gastrolobium bilobum]|uniref:uncharacterized protein LOC133298459 n=1 Tax=Gastrolobium bilobum TaxID=150636 RepID=UPI002AB0C74B|nr:uncharacterized protein LOC133298459 [Gastrolobium bilobum]